MKLSTRLILLFPVVLVLILATLALVLWRSDAEMARAETEKLLTTELLAAARTGALLLDGNKHLQMSKVMAVTPEWRELRESLEAVCEANNLTAEHCYTFGQPSADRSRLRWGVMLHDTPFVGNVYELPPANQRLLDRLATTKQAVATSIYEDEHGEWLSAMAPILTDTGEVAGVLQMDYDAKVVLGQIQGQLAGRRALLLGQVGAVGLVSLLGLVLLLRRWIVVPLHDIVTFAEGVARGAHRAS